MHTSGLSNLGTSDGDFKKQKFSDLIGSLSPTFEYYVLYVSNILVPFFSLDRRGIRCRYLAERNETFKLELSGIRLSPHAV